MVTLALQDQTGEDITGSVKVVMGNLRDRLAPFAEIVFTSVTPYWGGGYTGRTFRCINDDCSNYEFLWQGAGQFRGMLRWLARTVIASYIDDETLDRDGYRAVENYPHSRNALIKRLFGSASGDSSAASLFVVNIQIESKPTPFAEYSEIRRLFTQAKERCGSKKAIQCLEQRAHQELRDEACRHDNFICLFTVPRFYLHSMQINKQAKKGHNKHISINLAARMLFELQPAKPRTFVFRLWLRERSGAVLRPEEKFFLVSLALAEPVLLGLGKAIPRGFGRFLPAKNSYDFNTGREDYNEKLRKVAEELAAGPDREAIEQLLDTMLEAAAEALGVEHQPHQSLAAVPRLSYAHVNMRYVERLRHPCMLATREYAPQRDDRQGQQLVADYCNPARRRLVASSLEALSAVGKAVTKAVWKIYYYGYMAPDRRLPSGRAVREPGVGFHTWVLGLPRQQQGRGYVLGTMHVRGSECARSGRVEGGRRLSGIVVSVLPRGNGYAGVILPLVAAYDVPAKLQSRRLLHIGGHGRRSRQPDVTVVTDVVAAASLPHIRPRGRDPRCRSWTRPISSGVIKPSGQSTTPQRDGVLCAKAAVDAALDWLEKLLG